MGDPNTLRYNPSMRPSENAARILHLLRELGRAVRGPGRVYLVGGASALLEGWRDSTVDVDLKLDPEPRGVFEAIVYPALNAEAFEERVRDFLESRDG